MLNIARFKSYVDYLGIKSNILNPGELVTIMSRDDEDTFIVVPVSRDWTLDVDRQDIVFKEELQTRPALIMSESCLSRIHQ